MNIEAVAEAIWKADPHGSPVLAPVERDEYRAMARAAIDALQLTPEHRGLIS